MSGGSLDYFYSELEGHVGDFGDKELDNLVSDLAKLFHDREWYLSDDTSVGDWNEARDRFKEKWFTDHGRQERIEQYLDEFADEIRKVFGISTKYCMFCKHWTPDNDKSSIPTYGRCAFEKYCASHRYESCDKWEPKEGQDATD